MHQNSAEGTELYRMANDGAKASCKELICEPNHLCATLFELLINFVESAIAKYVRETIYDKVINRRFFYGGYAITFSNPRIL